MNKLLQPPLESYVPSHTGSVIPMSQHFDPASIEVPATASVPENCQPPAHASSESAVSGKVDYGLVKDFWLKNAFIMGLKKKPVSQSSTSSGARNCHSSHVDTVASAWAAGPLDISSENKSILQLVFLVTVWFKAVLLLVKL